MGDRFMAAREPSREWLSGAYDDLPIGRIIAGYLSITLHAAAGYFPYSLILFSAPPVVSVALYLSWLGGFLLVARLREERPWLALAVPVLEICGFFLLLELGVSQLGWRPV